MTTIPIVKPDDLAGSFDKLTAASERIRVLEEALPPADRLDALAKWLDLQYMDGGDVQTSLRSWAQTIRAALSHAEPDRSGG